MHGDLTSVKTLLRDLASAGNIPDAQLVICPPYPFIALCRDSLAESAIKIGAQDLSMHDIGPCTGEVSGSMLVEFGCTYVLVGHSERRSRHGEDDRLVAAKTKRALAAGLMPIVCVGETLKERQDGRTALVLRRQVQTAAAELSPAQLSHLVIAYEPLWAIGSGISASPDMAQEAHIMIRQSLVHGGGAVKLLYGGSVKADNATHLLTMPDVDGVLVGAASLDAKEFLGIASRLGSGVSGLVR